MKKILYVILALVALPLILALFVRKTYQIEQEIIINQPKEAVFHYVKFLKNQDEFSVWSAMDPKMEKYFRGEDGSRGFISGWKSENPEVGSGEQEILGIVVGDRIDYELRFKEPFESVSTAYLITEDHEMDQTRVRWGFTGKMKYPMNLMLLFLDLEKAIGSDLEKGLLNLKDILEAEGTERKGILEISAEEGELPAINETD